MRDYLKLHFIIFLWGLTGVIGRLIELPPVEIVLIRTAMAAVALGVLAMSLPGDARVVPLKARRRYFLTGMLIGIHWILFFLAIEISNISVCMVGMATVAFWSALLEPLLVKERRFKGYELLLGLVVVFAIWIIKRSGFHYLPGLMVALSAALVSTLFSIANGAFAKRAHHRVIAAYQMTGACFASLLSLPVSALYLSDGKGIDLVPDVADLGLLLLLALGCTVYAYSAYIELLKRLTVFTINLAYNLEPVYGIILGSLIFFEYQELSPDFFLGAALIMVVVIIHPVLKARFDQPKKRVRFS